MKLTLTEVEHRVAAALQAAGAAAPMAQATARALVLDTNIVLDLLVFADPDTALLRQLLHSWCWPKPRAWARTG